MSGLGGLNKSPDGVVVGVVQLQLPNVTNKQELAAQTENICNMVAKARRNLNTMDLVVFPEYALHGLSMDMNPEIMCRLDGPEVAAFMASCSDNDIWGCFSIMEYNPNPKMQPRMDLTTSARRWPSRPNKCSRTCKLPTTCLISCSDRPKSPNGSTRR